MTNTMFTIFRVDGTVDQPKEKKVATLPDDFVAVMLWKRRLKISNKEFEKGLSGELCKADNGLIYRFEFDDDYLYRLHTDALLKKYGDRLEREEIAEELNIGKKGVDMILSRAFRKLQQAGLFERLAEVLADIYGSENRFEVDIDMEVEYYE